MTPGPLPVMGQMAAPEVWAVRKDPYRLFFPLGVALGWAGVGQWLWFSLGQGGPFRSAFHATVQVQGFLACFVAGFLFTFIPRRTATPPPALWQLGLAALCPVLLTVFAWREEPGLAQGCWVLQLAVLLHLIVSRVRTSRNRGRPPPSLVWIPLALLMGLVGSAMGAFVATAELGRALVREGVVGALVMGIGAMLVPVITRAQPPPAEATSRAPVWPQLLLAVLFVASFVIQTQQLAPARVGYAMRLAITAWVLVKGAQLWKPPTQPGLNRWVVLVSAWCLPLGYAALTVWPEQRSAGLHVILIGGFGLLAFAIGQHVVVAHAGRGDWLASWPWPTWGLAIFSALALGARVAMQLDATHYFGWMTTAAAAFLAAGACWLWGMAPLIFKTR